MISYKEMYFELLQDIEQAISILQDAKNKATDICILNKEKDIQELNDSDKIKPVTYEKRHKSKSIRID